MQAHGRRKAAAWLVALALAGAPGARADAPPAEHVTRFELVSHGMTVGHARLVRARALRDGKPCREQRLTIESKVDLLVFKYALNSEETWIADDSGLLAYTLDSVENGRRKTAAGALRDGIFRCEITEQGKTRAWTAPRAAFDLDSSGVPAPPPAAGAATNVAVLDPAAGAIVQRVYRTAGRETLTVGGRQIPCETMTIEGPGLRIRRWIATDEFGPLVLREEGHEKRGPYSRRAVSMGPEPKAAE